ncbi:hypothetical protein SDC9_210027 [bioreactor metagenome]|uniref:Uncharacterized protein n=1 Tax=bioreactor metagenome TaxID=1076179 RepID=A0A645JGN7_9ZZZZ
MGVHLAHGADDGGVKLAAGKGYAGKMLRRAGKNGDGVAYVGVAVRGHHKSAGHPVKGAESAVGATLHTNLFP